MRTPGAIRYDFQKAMRDAEELEEAANRMRRLAESDMEDSKRILSTAWQGESSESYQRKYVMLQKKILDSAKRLKMQANEIRNSAKRAYDADMRAYRLANDRNY